MKKIVFYFLILSGNIIFAKNLKVITKSKIVISVCCQRSGSTSQGEIVTVRACVQSTVDFVIDKGNACSRARGAVQAAVRTLEDSY